MKKFLEQTKKKTITEKEKKDAKRLEKLKRDDWEGYFKEALEQKNSRIMTIIK